MQAAFEKRMQEEKTRLRLISKNNSTQLMDDERSSMVYGPGPTTFEHLRKRGISSGAKVLPSASVLVESVARVDSQGN